MIYKKYFEQYKFKTSIFKSTNGTKQTLIFISYKIATLFM